MEGLKAEGLYRLLAILATMRAQRAGNLCGKQTCMTRRGHSSPSSSVDRHSSKRRATRTMEVLMMSAAVPLLYVQKPKKAEAKNRENKNRLRFKCAAWGKDLAQI